MIIVDTSVWIEFLRGHPPYQSAMISLLEERRVPALDCIFGELLAGAKSERERSLLLSYRDFLPPLSDDRLFIRAGLHAGREKLKDRGVGLIDAAILVAALETGYPVWTLDGKLKGVMPGELVFPGI
jgi:predicted nucleic acid-binding protein